MQGADAIKVVLGHLPPGEEILRIGADPAEQTRGGAVPDAFAPRGEHGVGQLQMSGPDEAVVSIPPPGAPILQVEVAERLP